MNNAQSTQKESVKKNLWVSIIIGLIIGIIMIGFISLFSANPKSNWWINFGCDVLIAGASLSSGGFLGFIFGIPSIQQLPNAKLKYNDNLVQISDWLTKIIVGVGLTQLYHIPSFIKKIGIQLKPNFGNDDWGLNTSISIIGYFFVLGFLMIYFWTKTDYSSTVKEMDDDLNAKLLITQQQLVEETKQKVQAQQEKTEVVQILADVKKDSEIKAEDMQAVLQTFSVNADSIKRSYQKIKTSEQIPDDPQKGKWGGSSEVNGRKLTANVRETTFSNEWFNINLEVISTDTTKPLEGQARFYLHPSFPNEIENVEIENGTAVLHLVAYGAFTVGVETDNGKTKLELDLALLEDAPQLFKQR